MQNESKENNDNDPYSASTYVQTTDNDEIDLNFVQLCYCRKYELSEIIVEKFTGNDITEKTEKSGKKTIKIDGEENFFVENYSKIVSNLFSNSTSKNGNEKNLTEECSFAVPTAEECSLYFVFSEPPEINNNTGKMMKLFSNLSLI